MNSDQGALQLLFDGSEKELLESNLHVYGRDNTKIVIYSIERRPKKGIEENHKI